MEIGFRAFDKNSVFLNLKDSPTRTSTACVCFLTGCMGSGSCWSVELVKRKRRSNEKLISRACQLTEPLYNSHKRRYVHVEKHLVYVFVR